MPARKQAKRKNNAKTRGFYPHQSAENRGGLIAAWSACALCILAAFGGFSGGTRLSTAFHFDSLSLPLILRDMFGDFPVSGWQTGPAPNFFPDYLFVGAGLLLGSAEFSFAFYAAACFAAYAFGWMLAAQKISANKSAAAAAVLAAAMHPLFLGYGHDFVFGYVFTAPLHHGGAWLAVPYLLRLAMDISDNRSAPSFYRRETAMAVLLGAVAASDFIIVAWFVLPALFMFAAAFYLSSPLAARWKNVAAACAAGFALAFVLRGVIPLSAKSAGSLASGSAEAAARLYDLWAHFAAEAPPFFMVWCAFALCLAFFYAAFLRRHVPAAAAEIKRRGWRTKLNTIRGVAPAHFAVLFLTLCMLSGVAATVVLGYGEALTGTGSFARAGRYFYPAVYLPLFAGWIFLFAALFQLFGARLKRKSGAGQIAVYVCAAVLSAAAAPKIAGIKPISVFNQKFLDCLQLAAARHNLTAGMVPRAFAPPIMAAGMAGKFNIHKAAHVVNFRQYREKPPFLHGNRDNTNIHYLSGDFDFVAVNTREGKTSHSVWDDAVACNSPHCNHPLNSIDGESVVEQFGEPREIVNCGAADIYVYNPPVSLAGVPIVE